MTPRRPNVLLVNSFSRDGVYVSPPLGLFKLATQLHRNDIPCDILDYDVVGDDSEYLKRVTEGRYDVIGLSVTHLHMEGDLDRLWTFKLAAEQGPSRPYFVAGGQEAALNHKQWLELGIEVCFLGFADYTFRDFCLRLVGVPEGRRPAVEDLTAGIDGIAFHRADGELVYRHAAPLTGELFQQWFYDDALALEIDYQPYWNRVRREFERDWVGSAEFIVENVRLYVTSHCPRGCGFCSSQTFLPYSQEGKPKLTMLDGDQCAELVLHHHRVHGARMFQFSDDDFPVGTALGLQRLEVFCKRMIAAKADGQLNANAKFSCQARVADFMMRQPDGSKQVNRPLLGLMRQAGFMGFSVGIETFVDRLLKSPSINKLGIDHSDCQALTQAVLDAGMVPQMNIILAAPEADVEEVVTNLLRTAEWLDKGCDVVVRGRLEVYPGAPLLGNAEYPIANRPWRHPVTGETIDIVDFFIPRHPLVQRIAAHFDQSQIEELDRIKLKHGWKGNVHKRVVAYASLIAISRMIERPDLVEFFEDRMDTAVAWARQRWQRNAG